MSKIKINNGSSVVNSLEEMAELADYLIKEYKNYNIWLFDGDLGSGKTALIKLLCSRLGAIDDVSSPTFSIINEYHIEDDGVIYHFDLYRIENIDELDSIGIDEYLYSGNYCFIEWAEKLNEFNITNTISLKIEKTGDSSRKVSIDRCD